MEIILSKQCESLTGSLGSGFGFHIQRRKNGFYAKRNAKGVIPPDGRWKFILACAILAQSNLHITDIKVTNRELFEALREANLISPAYLNWNNEETYNASDIINFKNNNNL
jgi:hypothetical protein